MSLFSLLLVSPALAYLLGALTSRHHWQPAHLAAWVAMLLSLAAVPATLLTRSDPGTWLASAPVNLVMSVLVSLIGLVVLRFSIRYLAADPAEQRFRFWLQLCLAAVSLIIVTNHLLVFWACWTLISISLHQLLMCYPDRFRAVLAAHKKFIFARIGESSVLVAALLLWHVHGTFHIDQLLAAVRDAGSLSTTEQVAAVLLAFAALIKCAQMPMHGWLIQVVESPTPVSALLHAGVINLGGFLMISMAPLIVLSTPARWLLLVVAGLTMVLAALVMMTRISVKVRLAWSTSAQMGMMLVECALGLYQLALLHLVAHSCYKAHAFLGSGDTVQQWLRDTLQPVERPTLIPWLVNMATSALLVGAAMLLFVTQHSLALVAMMLLFSVAFSLWLPTRGTPRQRAQALAGLLALLASYLLLKFLFASLIPGDATSDTLAALWVMLLTVALIVGYGLLLQTHGRTSATWRRWLFAGFYLDEWVTRTTLRVWPVTLPTTAARKTVTTPAPRSPHERLA